MSSPSEEQQHVADQAGGEAIYSSEGMTPLPKPTAPLPTRSSRSNNSTFNEEEENYILEEETSFNPIQAFEVFSGRVFSSHVAPFASSSRHGRGESRLETLARIHAELQALEHEQEQQQKDTESAQAEQELVQQLSKRLHDLNASVTSSTQQRQLDLTALIHSKVQQLGKESSPPPSNSKDDDAPQVIYELIAGANQGTNGVSNEVEKRLERMEALVVGGGVGGGGGDSKSVMERLEQAEEKVANLTPQALELAASRAKVIRADLEAAAKAKSKLNTSTNTKDATQISHLYNLLTDLNGFLPPSGGSSNTSSAPMSNVLSTLVDRMQTCATLHTCAMEFEQQLHGLEGSLGQVEQVLASVESSLERVEKGMGENMEILKGNLEQLEQQLVASRKGEE